MAMGYAIINHTGTEHWVGDVDKEEREFADAGDGMHFFYVQCGQSVTGRLTKKMKHRDWKPDQGCKACTKYVSFY